MKLKIDREVLAAVLTKVAGTVSNKDVQPVLKNFLIKVEAGQPEGKIKVASTDMAMGAVAEATLPGVIEEGSVCVPAEKLFEMARSAPKGNMYLSLTGNELEIRTAYDDKDPTNPKSKNEWYIHCLDAALYPEFPEFKKDQAVSCDRKGLVEGLSRIGFATADNELKLALMAVYIDNGKMYAADGFRACRLNYTSNLKDIMIPAPAVSMLTSLLKISQVDTINVMKSKFHLLFQVGGDVYHTRLLEAKFPNLEDKLFKGTDNYKFKLKIKRAELSEAIKRAKITSEETNLLHMSFKNNQFVLETKNNVDDRFHEAFTFAEYDGGDFEKCVNWSFLEDLVTSLKEEHVVIRMDPDKGLVQSMYRIDEGQDFAAIILPARVKKDEKGKDVELNPRVKKRTEAAEAKKQLEDLQTSAVV
jgi:DNA polymerase III sliding clamp (beta) subunit (PCNA family)